MPKRIVNLDKFNKTMLAGGILLIGASLFYYLVIYTPGLQSAKELVEKAKHILEDFRQNSDNETQTLANRKSKIEAALREAEDNWLIYKKLTQEQYQKIYDRYSVDLKNIEKQLTQQVANHVRSIKTVQRLMALAQNIRQAYHDAEPSLKRFYLGLFWEKFLVKKGKVIKGILAEEVKDLIKIPKEPLSMPSKSTSTFLQREQYSRTS